MLNHKVTFLEITGHRCSYLWSKENNSKLSSVFEHVIPHSLEGKRVKLVPKPSVRTFHLLEYSGYLNVFTWPGVCLIVSSAGSSDDEEKIQCSWKLRSWACIHLMAKLQTILSTDCLSRTLRMMNKTEQIHLNWGKDKTNLQSTTRR